MSTEPYSRSKTIDNLGINSSIRYAQDQEYLDKTFSKEPSFISEQTTIDVTIPSFSSEFELIFKTSQRNKGWAAFLNPPGFTEQKKRLFTFQILPSLGPDETHQMHLARIKEKLDKDRKRHKKERDQRQDRGKKEPFEEAIEFGEEEKESEKIIRLIEVICNLDKILVEINSRRNQYQRG